MIYLILFAVIVWLVKYINRFCNNPYFFHVVVGSKGSGKSLYMSLLANKWMKERKGEVYSNMGIGFELRSDFWNQSFPPDSLILIDEIAVLHSNRDFANMPRQCIEWFKMQRKRRLTVVASSQTMDFDKKLRDLADRIYVCRKVGFLCILLPHRSTITMVATPDGGHELVNDIQRSGAPRIYSVPRSVEISSTLGYRTEQIIKKEEKLSSQSAPRANVLRPPEGKDE